MTYFKNGCILAISGILLGLPSCVSEDPWGTSSRGEGSIKLNLSALDEIEAAVPAVRAVSSQIATPPVADFQVKVSKTDGSYSQTFANVEEFVSKQTFSVGSYEIEAWYGQPDSQGFIGDDGAGYEYAYYYGKTTDITVVEGQTTEVAIGASLANSVIVIEYTEAFRNYFTDWSTTLQTTGNVPVELGSREGTTYVAPGNVGIVIDAELQNGNRVRLNPGSFETKPQHMYKMRYNIYNGEVGGVDQLVIEFDENLEEEPIRIDLSDELGNTPPPVVTPEGFENGQSFVTQSGTPFDGVVKFNVSAAGGISKAMLTVISDSYKPSYLTDGAIDLCMATAEQQTAMANDGIKALGFFRNPGEMAQLDLTGLCQTLPDGVHRFMLQVTDKNGLVNETVDVGLSCIPVEMEMTASPAPFGEGYVDINVSYNGPDPTAPGSNPFTFRSQGDFGYSDSEIISITKKDTRAYESQEYVYRITAPDVDRDEYEVRVYFGEQTAAGPNLTLKVPFEYPDYQLQLDPMTKKLRINVANDDPKKKTLFFHKLKVYINGNRLNEIKGDFSRDEPTGLIAVYNLEPSTTYTLKTTLQSAPEPTKFGTEETFTTTADLPVPNGDFSQTAVTIDKKLRVGGEWVCGAITYHSDCQFRYSEPTGGWASINKKTFYDGASSQNSWFMVASTYIDGNNVVIRTVGYNHSGTVPGRTGDFFSTKHYNTDAPVKSSFVKSSGELFLGTYEFNGTETRTDGVEFAARPTSLEFSYKYEPQQAASRGSAELVIYAEDGVTVINRRKMYLYRADTMTDFKIILNRYPFGVKPGKVCIKFLSSDLEEGDEVEITVPTEDALYVNKGLNSNDISMDQAKAMSIGSVLTVSNLRFNYGEKQ